MLVCVLISTFMSADDMWQCISQLAKRGSEECCDKQEDLVYYR